MLTADQIQKIWESLEWKDLDILNPSFNKTLNLRFARAVEAEVLRAQAEAGAVAWMNPKKPMHMPITNGMKKHWNEHWPDQASEFTDALYTHPTAPEAQPKFKPDWTGYRQGVEDGKTEAAQVGLSIPKEIDAEDAPIGMANEPAWAYVMGWNACRQEILTRSAATDSKTAQRKVLDDLVASSERLGAYDLEDAATVAEPSEYTASDYSADQWWFKELESLFVAPLGSAITADMKRAAKVAMDAFNAQQQAEPVGDEREDSGSLLGDGFVLEFERWNDVTGALPRSSSWVAEVSDIIQRAAQSGQRAGVAEGWCFYSADFSMNARNPANWGTVMLKRGDASSKWWHALSDEEREKIDLFVSGRGTTFEAALKAANEKAAAAPTQQKERGE
jgi:hypothetical protein